MLYLHTYKTILHTLHYIYISIDTKNVLTEVILHITIIIVRYNTTQKNCSIQTEQNHLYPVR